MWDWRVWGDLLWWMLFEFRLELQREVERFTTELENWINWLVMKPLPADWRRQTAVFLLHWEQQGFVLTPRSVEILEWWIEAWAKRRGFWPPKDEATSLAKRLEATEPVATDLSRAWAPDASVPHGVEWLMGDSRPGAVEAFYYHKLAEAKAHLDKIKSILEALGAKLDAAKLRQAVEIETEVDTIQERIGQYNDALASARAVWLREGLGGNAYGRLAAMDTPAALNLPLYTDVVQAQRAKEQEEQIGERLGRRTAALERILLAIQALDGAGPGVSLSIGGGVVVTAVQVTGQWSVVKFVPSAKGFPYAANVTSGSGETLRGLALASAVVTWWFLLCRRQAAQTAPPREPKNSSAEKAVKFDEELDVQYNGNGENEPAIDPGLSQHPNPLSDGSNNYVNVDNVLTAFAVPSEKATWNRSDWFQLTTEAKGINEDNWGVFKVKTAWFVNPAPMKPPKSANLPSTSWIIQHVTASFDIRDAKTGKPVHHPADDGHWNYREAWEVPPGKTSPPTVPGKALDDIFKNDFPMPNTCGTIIETGTAQFYPYTNLPPAFMPGGAKHAGILLSTENAGAMAGLQPRSFPPVTHTVIATWTTDNKGHTHVVNVLTHPGPLPPDDPTA